MLFSEFWLKPGLVRSLESIWYTQATPIQEKVMKIALSWKNIVWQSQTWTGKTAAFLLPVLNKIDTNKKTLQVLILAPTRELVNQIGDEIRNLTKFYGVTYACLYGGASPLIQKNNLKRNPAIVVATPGRLMDFMNQRVIDVRVAEYFILDEVDRMLDMGFVRDIKKIRTQLKNVKQTYTFSATMNDDMKTIIKEHISTYEFIKIGEAVTVDLIKHSYLSIDHEQKLYNLIKIIKAHSKDKVLIFTHTKRNTKTIHQILVTNKLNAGLLNGNMAQNKRQSTLNDFKQWKTQILVTTDVAARGLNMENVWLVINFDVPADVKSYIHRIGRTGRAGASGKAIMLVSPLENSLLKEIEKTHKIRIDQSELLVVQDREWTYGNIRLDRSTDKRWGGKNQKSQGSARVSSGGYKWSRPDARPERNIGFSSPDVARPSGGYKWSKPIPGKKIGRTPRPQRDETKSESPKWGGSFRWMGKPRHI